jgi:hypothetical protein
VLVILPGASPARVLEHESTFPASIKLIADQDYKLTKALNADFLPRAYLFDSTGNLAWQQTIPGLSLTEAFYSVRNTGR